MTKIQELEQKLDNAVEKFRLEMNECQKALAELKKSKKEGKWKPKDGEVYWYRNSFGQICYETEGNKDWQTHNIPVFKTLEACKRYWHFMDAVKEKSYEFSREEFENHNIRKHIIYYDFERKCFDIDRSINIKYFGEIYFKTEESAKYIIDNFSKELKEYWL